MPCNNLAKKYVLYYAADSDDHYRWMTGPGVIPPRHAVRDRARVTAVDSGESASCGKGHGSSHGSHDSLQVVPPPQAWEITFATKTDDDTERQLVHTLAHAIVFIV